MLLAIATFFVTCKPEPEPEPEPTYNLTFWTNEDLDGVIVVNLYDNGGYDKEGYISKVYSKRIKFKHFLKGMYWLHFACFLIAFRVLFYFDLLFLRFYLFIFALQSCIGFV